MSNEINQLESQLQLLEEMELVAEVRKGSRYLTFLAKREGEPYTIDSHCSEASKKLFPDPVSIEEAKLILRMYDLSGSFRLEDTGQYPVNFEMFEPRFEDNEFTERTKSFRRY